MLHVAGVGDERVPQSGCVRVCVLYFPLGPGAPGLQLAPFGTSPGSLGHDCL